MAGRWACGHRRPGPAPFPVVDVSGRQGRTPGTGEMQTAAATLQLRPAPARAGLTAGRNPASDRSSLPLMLNATTDVHDLEWCRKLQRLRSPGDAELVTWVSRNRPGCLELTASLLGSPPAATAAFTIFIETASSGLRKTCRDTGRGYCVSFTKSGIAPGLNRDERLEFKGHPDPALRTARAHGRRIPEPTERKNRRPFACGERRLRWSCRLRRRWWRVPRPGPAPAGGRNPAAATHARTTARTGDQSRTPASRTSARLATSCNPAAAHLPGYGRFRVPGPR